MTSTTTELSDKDIAELRELLGPVPLGNETVQRILDELVNARADVKQLTGALANARAVAGDRAADADRIARDVIAERNAANRALERVREVVEPIQVRADLKAGWNLLRAQVIDALPAAPGTPAPTSSNH